MDIYPKSETFYLLMLLNEFLFYFMRMKERPHCLYTVVISTSRIYLKKSMLFFDSVIRKILISPTLKFIDVLIFM